MFTSLMSSRIVSPAMPGGTRSHPFCSWKRALGAAVSFKVALLSSLLLNMAPGVGQAVEGQLQPGDTAPAELTELVSRLDRAASREDRRAVMRLYSNSFTHSDGLTFRTLDDAMEDFWERFSNLNYRTVINGWQQDTSGLVAETTTTVTGTQNLEGRVMNLTAIIRGRQRYENGRITQQEVLSEQIRMTSGQRPPSLQLLLPEQVLLGKEFNFDAIVEEPLGDRLLLGAAIDEPVEAGGYTTAAPINLELLPAGGLFKVGRAPATPGSRWLSAVIVREDGITIETRRLRVVPGPTAR